MRVHTEDAREELIDALGVPAEQVKVKSSAQDELAGIDLMSPFCPVRYIITKDALKEGWGLPVCLPAHASRQHHSRRQR